MKSHWNFIDGIWRQIKIICLSPRMNIVGLLKNKVCEQSYTILTIVDYLWIQIFTMTTETNRKMRTKQKKKIKRNVGKIMTSTVWVHIFCILLWCLRLLHRSCVIILFFFLFSSFSSFVIITFFAPLFKSTNKLRTHFHLIFKWYGKETRSKRECFETKMFSSEKSQLRGRWRGNT